MKPEFRIAGDNAEGAPERRDDHLNAEEEARSSGAPSAGGPPDPQVPAKAKRRAFSAAEIEKHLAMLDKLGHGDKGAYMRAQGLYSKQVADWRAKRLAGLTTKRGPQAASFNPLTKQLAERDRRILQLERRLKRAELMLEIQKKAQEYFASFPEKLPGGGESD
jgi:hypothetical protein